MTSVNQEPPPTDSQIMTAPDASADLMANSMGDYLRIVARRVRSGESGALPVIVGLIVIVIIFQVKNGNFLEPANLVNLMAQSAFVITLGMAEIFVLLLGDIDLAAGYTAACGAVVALWMVALGDPWWAAILVALAATAAFGALQGFVVARLGLPSFVVTLAGQLGLSGVLLYLINATGSIGVGGVITLRSNIINNIENGYLSPTATWIVMIAIAVVAGAALFYGDFRRRSAGLVAPPLSVTLLKVGGVIAAAVIVAAIANVNRGRGFLVLEGMPWSVLVVLGILFIWTVLLGRTRFGRYIYAIGGNAEAARRAGISIVRIRTLAFMLTGLTAGMTGIIYASYLGSISSGVQGGQNVLNAVAAAVIGGTSLFGGRGKMLHAVLGGLVVGVINNGLQLLGLSAAAQLMWTALVLLAAIIVDRVTRRSAAVRLAQAPARPVTRPAHPHQGAPAWCVPPPARHGYGAAPGHGRAGAAPTAWSPPAPGIIDAVSDNPGRRRSGRGTRPGRPRTAVHRQVQLGTAELVPDLDRADSWLLFLDGVAQSGVDLADPGYLEFEYVRRIGHVADLAFPPGAPLRALHLGGGALTLPRYLAHTRPGSRQLVAEVDDTLTNLVREHLPLPAGHRIRVRAADARAVVESVREASYDLVIADVFAGAVTPAHLTTAEFVAATARALCPGGVYAVNVAAGPPPSGDRLTVAGRAPSAGQALDGARSAVATLRSSYSQACMIGEASVLRGRRRGNLVLVGSDQPLPEAALGRAAAGDPFPARLVAGADLARFTAGAPVYTDVGAGIAAVPADGAGDGDADAAAAGADAATGGAHRAGSRGGAPQSTNW